MTGLQPLDILFASPQLGRLCHDDKLAKRTLGPDSARKLRARLDDLKAAANMAVCKTLPGRFHPLNRDREGEYSMSLAGGQRLVFEPVAAPTPTLVDGSIDLGKIVTIRVVYAGDYHD